MASSRVVREDFPRAFEWLRELVRQRRFRNAETMLRVARELFRQRGGSWLRRAWFCPIIKVSGKAGLAAKLGLGQKACRLAIANLIAAGVLVVVGASGYVQTATATGVARTPTLYQFSEAIIRQIDGSPDRFGKGPRMKPIGLECLLEARFPETVFRRWNGQHELLVEAVAKGFPDGIEENPVPLGARPYRPLEAVPREPEARRAVVIRETPRVPLPQNRYSDEARQVELVGFASPPAVVLDLGLRLSPDALKIFKRR